MSRQSKQHNQQFKQDAVKYVLEHPDLTQEECAKNLGIGLSTLSRWRKQFTDNNGIRLFEKVIDRSLDWGYSDNLMFVVGATQGKKFADIRKHAPNNFLLVPGVGAQGGDLHEVCKFGMTKDCGLLVNSSRAIIYASKHKDFADAAAAAAEHVQEQMRIELESLNG